MNQESKEETRSDRESRIWEDENKTKHKSEWVVFSKNQRKPMIGMESGIRCH